MPRRKRWFAAVAAVALVVVSTMAWTWTARAADEGPNPFATYKLSGEGVGIRISYSAANPLGLNPLVEVTVPQSTTALSAGPLGHALSAVVFPGPLLSDPQSLADSGGYATPTKIPGWPIRAQADTAGPTETRDTSTVPGAVMDATAKEEVVTADARYPSWAQAVGSFASARTTATSKRTGDTVVSEATSFLHDVDVMGFIHIDSVTTLASATTDGRAGRSSGETRLAGVTVAGQKATIDGSGVHVSGSADNPAVSQVRDVLKALASAGITVRLTEPVEQRSGPTVQRTAPGVMVEVPMKLSGTPLGDLLDQIPASQFSIPGSPFNLADAIAVIQGTQVSRVFVGAAAVSADGRPAPPVDAAAGGLGGEGDLLGGGGGGVGVLGAGATAGDSSTIGGTGAVVAPPGRTALTGLGAPAGASRTFPLSSTTFLAAVIAFLIAAPLLAAAGRRFAHAVVGAGDGTGPGACDAGGGP